MARTRRGPNLPMRARISTSASDDCEHGGRSVKALLPVMMLGALAGPARAGSLEVLGYAGVLGEWELSATVSDDVSQAAK